MAGFAGQVIFYWLFLHPFRYLSTTLSVASDGNLVPDYSGVRPKLQHPDGGQSNTYRSNDFIIAGLEYHGVKGLTLLLGIESPG